MQRLLPVACAVLLGACAYADKVETLDTTLLRKSCADPWLFRHDGKFYLTQTGTAKVRVLEVEERRVSRVLIVKPEEKEPEEA